VEGGSCNLRTSEINMSESFRTFGLGASV
jgi:hypothetical protein